MFCPLLDFGQPQTSAPFPSLSLSVSLACGSAALTHRTDQLSGQHRPALYGVLGAAGSTRVCSLLQPMPSACLPRARRWFGAGERVSKAGRSLPSPLGDPLRAGRFLWVSRLHPLSSVSFTAEPRLNLVNVCGVIFFHTIFQSSLLGLRLQRYWKGLVLTLKVLERKRRPGLETQSGGVPK